MKNLKTILLLAGLLALGISGAGLAQGTHEDGTAAQAASPDTSGIRPTVTELDRLLIDARRQLELLRTVSALTEVIETIRPFGKTILVLLDESRPMAERWQKVLATPATIAVEGTPSEPLLSKPLEQELRMLRDRVEVLDAQLAVLNSAPGLPFAPALPAPEPEAHENPELVLEEQIENWRLDADAVRYAQAGRVGVQPAVWLDSPTGGVRLAVGSSMRVGERAIRLDRLDRRRDGGIRLQFTLDGKPVNIDW